MADQPDTVGDVTQVLREARVVSVDRVAGTCVVAIGDPDSEHGETESDPIDWLVPRAGETIVWSPPSEGEQGLLLCPGGDIAQGLFLAGTYSSDFPAPGSGTRHFVRFGDDAEFGYDPEQSAADATLPSGGTLTIVADGGISLTGDVTIEGNLNVQGGVEATEDVVASGISLNGHTHSADGAGPPN